MPRVSLLGMPLPDHRRSGPELVGQGWRSCPPLSAPSGACASPAVHGESPSACWPVELRCRLNAHASDSETKLACLCPTGDFARPAAVEQQHF